MSSTCCPNDAEEAKRQVAEYAMSLGFSAVGFARVDDVDADSADNFDRWITERRNGTMEYLERYADIRRNPSLLLDGARTVIVAALNYYPARRRSPDLPQFAFYAYGRDYHEVMRERLASLGDYVREHFGGSTRACVDTAPIRERYWAVKAGVGFVGKNSTLIIPGKGSFFFIGELLTTVEFPPDEPCTLHCGACSRCVDACPGRAIVDGCRIDARRCLSYLTIEHRGPLPDDVMLGNHVYGCDECQLVCPHNLKAEPTAIPEFVPTEAFLALDREAILAMTPVEFSEIFRHSAVKRAKLDGLQRNAKRIN